MEAEGRGENVSDEELRDVMINFLIAGIISYPFFCLPSLFLILSLLGRDTTATALSWSFYRLFVKHKDVLKKCRADIDESLGGSQKSDSLLEEEEKEGSVGYASAAKMKYPFFRIP